MSVYKIINLPIDLKTLNESIYNLVKKYYNKEINQDSIRQCLVNNKHLLDEWIIYSENKRVPEGWTIEKNFFFYDVYYYKRGNKLYLKRFTDKCKAVSYFIYEEILSIYNEPRLL